MTPTQIAQLHQQHATQLQHYSRRFLRDPVEAQDVVQEVFTRLLGVMAALDVRDEFSYLQRCVRNECLRRIRFARIRNEGWRNNLRHFEEQRLHSDLPERVERRRQILDALASATPETLKVAKCFAEGYSVAELSESTGRSRVGLYACMRRLSGRSYRASATTAADAQDN